LFFAESRGDSVRLWNIGSLAVGTFDPETLQVNLSWQDRVPRAFRSERSGSRLSWEHHFEDKWDSKGWHNSKGSYGGYSGKGDWYGKDWWNHDHQQKATFLLEGAAVVAIPATLVLYASGLLGLGSWVWLKRRQIQVRNLATRAGCRPVDERPASCRS
jgi:hypothetical protein